MAHLMASPLRSMPMEVLTLVSRHLQAEDIQNVRLVCKVLHDASSPFLIQSAWISTRTKDQDLLMALSRHPIFSKSIRQIVYDGSFYQKEILSSEFGQGREEIVNDVLQSFDGLPRVTILSAFHQYWIDHDDWVFAQRYRDETLLRPWIKKTTNSNLQIDSFKRNFSTSDEEKMQMTRFSLPADLKCLLDALVRMPKVQSISISDRRWMRWQYNIQRYFQMDHTDIPERGFILQKDPWGDERYLSIEPRPWPNTAYGLPLGHNRGWYRGFFVLIRAMTMSRTKLFQEFTIDGGEDYPISTGLSHRIFQMNTIELSQTRDAFKYLAKVKLMINTHCERSWSSTLKTGNIAHVLTAARALTELEITFDVPKVTVPQLKHLIGGERWPSLTKFSLGKMILRMEDLIDFLSRHAGSLASVSFSYVSFSEGDLSPSAEPWVPVFQALAAMLHLIDFRMEMTEMGSSERLPTNFQGRDRAKIMSYLRAGGKWAYYDKEAGCMKTNDWARSTWT